MMPASTELTAPVSLSNRLQSIMHAGLYLFAVSLPISHVPPQIGIAITLLAYMVHGIVCRHWLVRWDPFLAILGFYIGWNLIAAAVSPRPLHSLAAVADNEWASLVMVMLFWVVRRPDTLKRIVFLFLLASFLAVAYGVLQAFVGIEYYRGMKLEDMGGYHRAIGFYGFYLSFGALAMSVFFTALSYLFDVKKWRFASGALTCVSLFAILASFARSVWLSLAIGIPAFGFLRSRKAGLLATSVLVIIFSVGIITQPALRYRAESIIDVSQNQTRLNLWKTALAMGLDNAILGVGEDNWDFFVERYKVEGYYDTTTHPHNDYLNVFVSSGVPGLAAFVAMWLVALTVGVRTWKKTSDPELKAIVSGATLSLLGFLVAAFFQDYYGTFVNCLGWWFMVGLIFGAHRLSASAAATTEAASDHSNR